MLSHAHHRLDRAGLLVIAVAILTLVAANPAGADLPQSAATAPAISLADVPTIEER